MIGIMVVTPFAAHRIVAQSVLRMSLETVLQFVAVIGALALMFGSPKSSGSNSFISYSCRLYGWPCVRDLKA